MSKRAVVITSPSGNKFPVKNADEGSRFMFILTNGYLDIDVVDLKKQMESKEDTSHTCGGWTISVYDNVDEKPSAKYKLTKGDDCEEVSTAEAIAHVCDCTINTVISRLKKDPAGFTVKGWNVELVK